MSMQHSSRRTFVVGSVAATATIIARRPARAQSGVVRVLMSPTAVGALPLFAREKGFFDQVGLAVELTPVNSGAAALAAVAGGAVEIGLGNAGSIAAAVLKRLPFTIIADGCLYDQRQPTDFLCVALNSTMAQAADLSGKSVAVNGLKQVMQAGAQSWIDQNGGKSEDVRFIEMPVSTMAAAIESGRIDAAVISEPAMTLAKHKVKVIGTPEGAVAPLFSQIACACDRSWVEKNREHAQRFKSAMERAAQWANDNTREAKALLAENTHISPAIASLMTPTLYPTTLEAAHLQPVVDVMVKYGYLSQRVNANNFITRL